MVLVFTGVAGFAILATGAMVAVLEIRDPTVDTESVMQSLLSIISAILGALLGLLAGKSDSVRASIDVRPDGSQGGLASSTRPPSSAL